MNGIKVRLLPTTSWHYLIDDITSRQNEENVDLQNRSAVAVASFIEFCVRNNISQPPDKIVKNLYTFLCQDVEQTPTFAYTRSTTCGILSFQAVFKPTVQRNDKESSKDKTEASPSDNAVKARLSRRGAGLAFDKLSAKFGPRLLEVISAMWQSMAGGLLSACATRTSQQALK
jgi:TATA-binding protein-associated factor